MMWPKRSQMVSLQSSDLLRAARASLDGDICILEECMTFLSTVVFKRLLIPIGGLPLCGLLCWAQAPNGKTKPEVPVQIAAAHESASASIPASGAERREDSFVIGDDDVLAVNVWKEAEISRTVTVRSDGKISLPLVGEVQASTKTPKQLEADISSKLSGYISEPAVTVIVQEIRSQR